MKVSNLIEKKVKVFHLVQVKEIIQNRDQRLFVFDESKAALCLGIVIDDLPIALAQNKIYSVFNYSGETELNKYYLYETYDLDTKIPTETGSVLIEIEPDELQSKYDKTLEWYYNEFRKNKNIINFEKEKVLRYERSKDV